MALLAFKGPLFHKGSFLFQLKNIQHHIRLTKEHIDKLNERFADYQHPPRIFLTVSFFCGTRGPGKSTYTFSAKCLPLSASSQASVGRASKGGGNWKWKTFGGKRIRWFTLTPAHVYFCRTCQMLKSFWNILYQQLRKPLPICNKGTKSLVFSYV